ncbi:MAG: ATP-binding protein [Bacillota bacterium]
MKVLRWYDSKVSSNKDNIRKLVNDIVSFLCDYHGLIDQDTIFEIKVILNELFQNAIKHGNKDDINKLVKVKAGIANENYAFFIIEDEGEGFNYRCLFNISSDPEKAIELCDLKENGRGMLIVKSLCEKMKFNKKGNKVVVLKRLC